MMKYLTWIVYLVNTCVTIRPVSSQYIPTECCLFCDNLLEKLNRQHRQKIATSNQNLNQTCEFRIQPYVASDFIRIETSRFQLIYSVGCQDEYVEIFDDRSTLGSPISIGRWCGKSYARHVDISGRARIRFKNGGTKDPFYMTVISVDAGFYGSQKYDNNIRVGPNPVYIYSPGYPHQYPSSVEMQWNVSSLTSGQLINVDAVEFQMEEPARSGGCLYDNLTLFTVAPHNETGVWCGRNGIRFFQSESNLVLSLRTDKEIESKGFALRLYTSPVRNTSCLTTGVRTVTAHSTADILSLIPTEKEGTICSWLIQSDRASDVIQLEVIAWDTDVLLCSVRRLEIYDGIDDSKHQLLSKCGSVHPFGFIRSSGNAVYIVSGLVLSRPDAFKHGFKIKYSAVYKYYFEDRPLEAIKSRSLIWIPVMSAANTRPDIKLRSDSPYTRCVNVEVLTKWLHEIDGSFLDYIDVYDGTTHNARLMGVCSGGDKSSISGSLDMLHVKVKIPVINEGFWLAIDTTINCDGDTEVLRVTSNDQRLSFPTPWMKISNRFFPRNTVCKWRLEKSIDTGLIHLDVLDLKLSNNYDDDCRSAANYLVAYDGPDSVENKVETWCDDNTGNVTSVSDLWLQVRVIDFLSERKFTIRYWMEPLYKCNDVKLSAKAEWAYLTSPGFPSNYPNNVNCSWSLISENPLHHIRLEVIESKTHSCADITTVYNGMYTTYPYLKFCNQGYTISSMESVSQSLRITFQTDSANTDKGFKFAYYSIDPNDKSTASMTVVMANSQTQTLTSPNYPSKYDRGIVRSWLIRADSPSSVVTLQQLIADQMRPCRNEYDILTAYDGPNSASPVLGEICTRDASPPEPMILQSQGDTVFLHLKAANSSMQFMYTGTFRFIYTSGNAQRACLSGETERLTATGFWRYLDFPSHSGKYSSNAECQWQISSSNHSGTISIEVTKSDLEESYTCAYDAVTVYDGYSSLSKELGVFCGRQTPEYQSSGQYLYLVFKSDEISQRSGFTLRYRITPSLTTSDGSEADGQSIGLLVGGTLGGVFLLLVAITCFMCILGRSKRAAQRPEPRESVVYNRNNSTVYVVSPVYMGGAGSPNAAPPPPYPGISNPAYSVSPSDDLPPSYHEYTRSESQQPSTLSGENPIYHIPTEEASALPSPPPYSEFHETDLPESPPAYETAIRSGSPKPVTGADNLLSMDSPSRRLPGSDNSRGDSAVSPRLHIYEALGPV